MPVKFVVFFFAFLNVLTNSAAEYFSSCSIARKFNSGSSIALCRNSENLGLK